MDEQQRPKSFNELLSSADKPVLVDFWAEWCGPCRMVSPIVEQIAKEYSGRLITVKVNVEQKSDIALQHGIQSIPTIVLFWKGKEIMRAIGAQSASQLKAQIDSSWPREL